LGGELNLAHAILARQSELGYFGELHGRLCLRIIHYGS